MRILELSSSPPERHGHCVIGSVGASPVPPALMILALVAAVGGVEMPSSTATFIVLAKDLMEMRPHHRAALPAAHPPRSAPSSSPAAATRSPRQRCCEAAATVSTSAKPTEPRRRRWCARCRRRRSPRPLSWASLGEATARFAPAAAAATAARVNPVPRQRHNRLKGARAPITSGDESRLRVLGS